MPGSLSDYAENKVLDHILNVATFPVPGNIYVALCTSDPGEAATGTTIATKEPAGNNYARKLFNTWVVNGTRAIENNGAITFNTPTGGDWGTITHFALCDAATGGNVLAYGQLSTSKTVGVGQTPSFASGAIDISFNAGAFSDYLALNILKHMFKIAEYIVPANRYVALCTSAPNDNSTGSNIVEPSGNGYARVAANAWAAAANGATSNSSAIDFPQATGSWGTITHAAIVDAPTGGNLLLYGALSGSVAITSGDTASFAIGDLDVTLN